MKVYTLLYHENSDDRCDAEVMVFTSLDEARARMRECYERSLEHLKFDQNVQKEDHCCYVEGSFAQILDGMDSYDWEIEEHDLTDGKEE